MSKLADASLRTTYPAAIDALKRFFDLVKANSRYLPEMHSLRVNAMAGNYYHLTEDQIQGYIHDNDKMNEMFKVEFDKRFPAKAKQATAEKVTADAVVHGNILLHEYARYLQNDNLPALDPPKEIIIPYTDAEEADYRKFIDTALAKTDAYFKKFKVSGRYYTLDAFGERTDLKRAVYTDVLDLVKAHNQNKATRTRKVGDKDVPYAQTVIKKDLREKLLKAHQEGTAGHTFKDKVHIEVIAHGHLKTKAKEYEAQIKELRGAGGDVAEVSKKLARAKKELIYRKKWRAVHPVKAKKYNLTPMRASEFATEAPRDVRAAMQDIIDRAVEIEKKYGV